MKAHSFHIPVMGLGYTIETPAKVARYGISSVISIVEDNLIEKMRKLYFEKMGKDYLPISVKEEDYRAKRITSYLNVIKEEVDCQFQKLIEEEFIEGSEINKYFELLPETSDLKIDYLKMLDSDGEDRIKLESKLKTSMVKGDIDVNIMTKLDKFNYDKNGEQLPAQFCDAMSALRGFALSDLSSSIVFSAGLNPRLFSYCAEFPDFFPDLHGNLKKKIILKVSDFRSALIQGKFLAKKGLWVSEFRIESGLNCGGHAFASGGTLLGPILEDFKNKREELASELRLLCQKAWESIGISAVNPNLKITVQGGVGTAEEHQFLLEYYSLDGVGWGSPFLMVPEAVSIDNETLGLLINAKKEDYYLSDASPLGVPFNNIKNTTAEQLIAKRRNQDRPGSPCYKKFLQFNTEFTKIPICTASREYQHQKIKQMALPDTPKIIIEKGESVIKEKECLCEGLAAAALLSNGIEPDRKLDAVSICPGPNLAYFSGEYSLKEMIDHIYGRAMLLNENSRSHVFVNELRLNVSYLENQIKKFTDETSAQKIKFVEDFKRNLTEGISYYFELFKTLKSIDYQEVFDELIELEKQVYEIKLLELSEV